MQPRRTPTDKMNLLREFLRSRHLLEPVLLFLSAHRPLSFVAGQALVALNPLAALLGLDLHHWADQLNQPQDSFDLPSEPHS